MLNGCEDRWLLAGSFEAVAVTLVFVSHELKIACVRLRLPVALSRVPSLPFKNASERGGYGCRLTAHWQLDVELEFTPQSFVWWCKVGARLMMMKMHAARQQASKRTKFAPRI